MNHVNSEAAYVLFDNETQSQLLDFDMPIEVVRSSGLNVPGRTKNTFYVDTREAITEQGKLYAVQWKAEVNFTRNPIGMVGVILGRVVGCYSELIIGKD